MGLEDLLRSIRFLAIQNRAAIKPAFGHFMRIDRIIRLVRIVEAQRIGAHDLRMAGGGINAATRG